MSQTERWRRYPSLRIWMLLSLMLMVQAHATSERTRAEMSFEAAFLNGLDDEELRAVIAHELGHVWIYTHHPYLQTEDLANSIAFKAVSQASLNRVYDKVRARNIVAGNLSASSH